MYVSVEIGHVDFCVVIVVFCNLIYIFYSIYKAGIGFVHSHVLHAVAVLVRTGIERCRLKQHDSPTRLKILLQNVLIVVVSADDSYRLRIVFFGERLLDYAHRLSVQHQKIRQEHGKQNAYREREQIIYDVGNDKTFLHCLSSPPSVLSFASSQTASTSVG